MSPWVQICQFHGVYIHYISANGIYHVPPNLPFCRVFMVNNVVSRWPKPLFSWFWWLVVYMYIHIYIYISKSLWSLCEFLKTNPSNMKPSRHLER